MKILRKKGKEASMGRGSNPETAQKIESFKRNVVRTRVAIEAPKKIRFFSTQEKKKKRKNMKAKLPSNGPLLTNLLHRGPIFGFSQKNIVLFTMRTSG